MLSLLTSSTTVDRYGSEENESSAVEEEEEGGEEEDEDDSEQDVDEWTGIAVKRMSSRWCKKKEKVGRRKTKIIPNKMLT
jgi:predicted DNA binding CopG/RHH family protein